MKKRKLAKITGGKSLIKCLYDEGVRIIFGLPGVQIYDAIIPILDYPDMKFITVRHEQATTYMADGYARAGGKIGVAMVVPGPGLQNASAGITNAYASSSPAHDIEDSYKFSSLMPNGGSPWEYSVNELIASILRSISGTSTIVTIVSGPIGGGQKSTYSNITWY